MNRTINKKAKKFDQQPFETANNTALNQTRALAKDATKEDGFSIDKISIVKDRSSPQPIQASLNATPIDTAAKGLSTDTLFSVALSDDKKRFVRLENAVQNLTNKINKMYPAINRLIEIDQDLNSITYQLEALIKQRNVTPQQPEYREVRAAPTPVTPVEPQEVRQAPPKIIDMPEERIAAAPIKDIPSNNTKTAVFKEPQNIPRAKLSGIEIQDIAPASGGNIINNTVHNVRVADHAGKTRIVFETKEKPQFTIEVDNFENLVLLGINNSDVSFNPQRPKSTLIEDIQITNGLNRQIVFATTKQTKKINQGLLPPDAKHPYHRLFVDLER